MIDALSHLPPPPEALRQRFAQALQAPLLTPATGDAMRWAALSKEFCDRDGHRLIPDGGDLYTCRICAKRFRLVTEDAAAPD